MNLFTASNQWANRPADERFWTLEEMLKVTTDYAANACQAVVKMQDLTVSPSPLGLSIATQKGTSANLSNWGFQQVCNRVSAPAGYLSRLPAANAAQCLNYGLQNADDDGANTKILFNKNPDTSLLVRAFTSDRYSRIWNRDIMQRLVDLPSQGWQVPPARPVASVKAVDGSNTRIATEEDCLRLQHPGLSIKPGDIIAPAGLYASNHDMFAFLVNEQHIDDGTEGGLGRGVFVQNSEVGAAAFKVTRFLYRYICGNHIVWDASEVKELRIVHKGRANSRFGSELVAELRQYGNQSAGIEEGRIATAKRVEIGSNKDEVLDRLFGKKQLGLSRTILDAAYVDARREADTTGINPRSVWGMVQGITSVARSLPYADDRNALDRSAGKLMSIDF